MQEENYITKIYNLTYLDDIRSCLSRYHWQQDTIKQSENSKILYYIKQKDIFFLEPKE